MGDKQIIDFHPDHVRKMKLREFDMMVIDSHGADQYSEMLDLFAFQSLAYTLVIDNNPVCCGGVVPLWDGVGEAWSLSSDLVDKYPLAFHKSVRLVLDTGIEHFKLHRLQCTVLASYQKSKRWLKRLGFHHESKLKHYGPDKQDYYRYVRLI